MAKTGNNELIITYYASSLFSLLHCYYPLLPLLLIITCYQWGNLQMDFVLVDALDCVLVEVLCWVGGVTVDSFELRLCQLVNPPEAKRNF